MGTQLERYCALINILLLFLFSVAQSDSFSSVITDQKLKTEAILEDEIKFDFGNDDEESFRPYYALNPIDTRRLALLEQDLVSSLTALRDERHSLANDDDLCYLYLSKYLSEFEQDTKAVSSTTGNERANIVTDNPILILKMIRRITQTLMNLTIPTCDEKGHGSVKDAVSSVFTIGSVAIPEARDLEDALLGLLRIQYIYGLNATNEMRLGNLNGINTRAFLYFDDCLALGKKAIDIEAAAMAYQWLTSAPLSPPEMVTSQEHMNEDMWELQQTWIKLLNLTLLENFDLMHTTYRNKRQEQLKDFSEYRVYATCRGEKIEEQNMLICFYQTYWDPYFYINPVKTELLSENPVVLQFYDIVSDKTINYIRKSVSTMTRSGVINIEEARTDYTRGRTSMNGWMYNTEEFNPHPIMAKLYRTIEKLTGLELFKEDASHTQVALYSSLGGHYDFHHDSLSDVKAGGYTALPFIGTFAKPIKGSAVLWYNLKFNGKPETSTEHGGCPVILGTKSVANCWILHYANMWTFPCGLYHDE